METAPRHVIVMGVSGSGKSTTARSLRDRTGWLFAEGDDFHSPENIAKMEAGTPLTDEDRGPWLDTLCAWLKARHDAGVSSILTCSALKRRYRDTLRGACDGVVFVHLQAPEEELKDRLGSRQGHFVPPSLLDSQLETLEELEDDEPGFVFSTELPPKELLDAIVLRLRDR